MDYDRLYDRDLTRHLDAKYGEPSEPDPDLIAEERAQALSDHLFRMGAGMARTQRDAYAHAVACLQSRSGWDEETLSHNIESNFPSLGIRECDDIADLAIKNSAAQVPELIDFELEERK